MFCPPPYQTSNYCLCLLPQEVFSLPAFIISLSFLLCIIDKQVEEALGPIDVLVNNAGVAVQSPSLKQTKREWEKVRKRKRTGLEKEADCQSDAHAEHRVRGPTDEKRRPRGRLSPFCCLRVHLRMSCCC